MQNIKVEEWEKWGICFLRLSPVKEDEAGNPVEDQKGDPLLDAENAAVVCALPQMEKSRTQGIFSSITTKILSVFNPNIEEVVDMQKVQKKLLRGITSKTMSLIPRKKVSRTDGKGNRSFFKTQVQPEEYEYKNNEVRGSLGVYMDPEFPDRSNVTPKFSANHAKLLKDILNAASTLGVFRGATGDKDFSEGRSMLDKMIGKYIVWDLCDENGNTIQPGVGNVQAA